MDHLELKNRIKDNPLPKHVAVIMDGNGRWAKNMGKTRIFGHRNGVRAVRAISEAGAEIGVKYLTLYAFSTENWSRPKIEVNALMSLLVETIHREIETLNKNNIRLRAIGDLSQLPSKTYDALMSGIEDTKENSHMDLTLALNYSGRWEIKNAIQSMVADAVDDKIKPEDITESMISNYLATHFMPDPELLIRTSGEMRLSNFLLWQCAYTEFFFTEKMWPQFTKEDFFEAIIAFQNRERRFGKTGEQIV
ncbi:isoprenyl transferase [Membranihabitans marinus]|uniref:isoprenyl transferase n=1 Tax=Membranihabitans marinus TaxID=1227546 RepID=UPI001F00DF85|nr:isoprenyl transferase [Membranihabitans marinus]